MQRLQTQGGRCVWEDDGEHLFGVHQELGGVVPLLEIVLHRQDKTSEHAASILDRAETTPTLRALECRGSDILVQHDSISRNTYK